jgi:acetylornithine deacetylase/succinyl-diaminopimelate desuccinylase-like protein
MMNTEKMLRDLIALPSVNPAFLPPQDPHAGEERMVDYLAKLARRTGLAVHVQKVLSRRANLLVSLSPSNCRVRRRVMLAPHLDTVGGEELPGHHFTPRKRNGRLYGRGACDTKGSVAAMFAALLEIAQSRQRPKETEILFAGLVDEENNQAGSRALIRNRFKADLAIVGEPTSLRVVTAHKGDLWLQLETVGKAAHGARPELGNNAIHTMAQVVDTLETAYAAFLRKKRHSLLGHATVNVGVIRGGRQPNIVPDHCVVQVDRRTLPGEKDAEVKRHLLRFLRERGLKAALRDTKGVPSPSLKTDPNLVLVRQLMRQAGQTQALGVHFFSDAGVLGAGGIPSVLFGPGDIAQAHTETEWIDLRQLERARTMLVNFLRELP